MISFSPGEAAGLAQSVYKVLASPRPGNYLNLPAGYELAPGGEFEGKSGIGIFAKDSAFGYIARHVDGRDAIIAIRGTRRTSARDWTTNLHVGFRPGPSGTLVHTGFHRAFLSFQQNLRELLRDPMVNHVHCVGHSLGGALATLSADLVSVSGKGATLYTFGSPRVGSTSFANGLTARMPSNAIFRVFHDADPVAMLPLFPFFHAPNSGPQYRWKWDGGCISVSAHDMDLYANKARNSGWVPSATLAAEIGGEVKAWLTSANAGVLPFSVASFIMIRRALIWILEKALLAGLGGAAFALQQTGTAMDLMAHLLATGIHALNDMAEWVVALVGKVLRFLGRATVAAAEMTAEFIRWALGLMASSIGSVASAALALAS